MRGRVILYVVPRDHPGLFCPQFFFYFRCKVFDGVRRRCRSMRPSFDCFPYFVLTPVAPCARRAAKRGPLAQRVGCGVMKCPPCRTHRILICPAIPWQRRRLVWHSTRMVCPWGKRFQSYGPQIASYADILGLIREARIKLRVVSTCDVSLSHSWRGNSLSVVARALMK